MHHPALRSGRRTLHIALLHNSPSLAGGRPGGALAPAQGNAHGVSLEPTPNWLCFLAVEQSCGVDDVRESSHHATLTPTSHQYHLHIHNHSNSNNTPVAMTH